MGSNNLRGATTVVEKRRATRFPMALPVILAKPAEAEEMAQTRDVSSGGVYFEVAEAPSPGSRLEFVLTLPAEITLTGPVQIAVCGSPIKVSPYVAASKLSIT